MPRRAEAACAALARRQLVDLAQLGLRDRDHDELGDSHSRFDDEGGPPVSIVKNDTKLASIA
jgi:hypothetical protein